MKTIRCAVSGGGGDADGKVECPVIYGSGALVITRPLGADYKPSAHYYVITHVRSGYKAGYICRTLEEAKRCRLELLGCGSWDYDWTTTSNGKPPNSKEVGPVLKAWRTSRKGAA